MMEGKVRKWRCLYETQGHMVDVQVGNRNATEELKRRIVEGTITKLEMFFQRRFRGFVKKQIDNKINTDGEPFVLTNNRRIHYPYTYHKKNQKIYTFVCFTFRLTILGLHWAFYNMQKVLLVNAQVGRLRWRRVSDKVMLLHTFHTIPLLEFLKIVSEYWMATRVNADLHQLRPL